MVGGANLCLPHLLLEEVYHLFGFGRFGFPFDAGVDVLGVLAEDDHVELLWALDRARYAREVAHRTQTHVKVEHLAQGHVERADTAAHRRGERTLDSDQVLAKCLDGFVGQPGFELLERLLARVNLHPGDCTLAAVSFLDRAVKHVLRGTPDVGTGAVALDKGQDRPIGYFKSMIGFEADLLAVGGNLNRFVCHRLECLLLVSFRRAPGPVWFQKIRSTG
jgi:hypothetical protein